jgi:hypothetical protein
MQQETIQEYVDSRGIAVGVDREQGVIRGAKILGLESRNGRSYLPEALAEAAGLYEGAKVNVNHAKGNPAAPRDYQDRLGVIRNVVARPGAGLFGDLYFNPKHALAEQLIWDAEHSPENVGFSHNVLARISRRGDRTVVEAITKVQSVDLVADPATTRGLFESLGEGAAGELSEQARRALAELSVQTIQRHRPDLVEAVLQEQDHEVRRLRAELDRLRLAEAVVQRRQAIKQLLAEFRLPDPDTAAGWARSLVSEAFVENLMSAPDEASLRKLVEERAALVREASRGQMPASGGSRPLAREQNLVDVQHPGDAKAFLESIT